MNQSTKDIISGFITGWTQVIIMQPFQIIKVRLQTQSSSNPYYLSITDAFKKILKQQGALSFYKGTVAPLIGIGFQASAMFFTYQFSKRLFSPFKKNPKDRLPIQYIALSGVIASLPTSIIAGPVQHTRIRIQIQGSGSAVAYNGSIDAGKKIVSQFGVKGLYKGFFPTWGRQAIGQAVYFSTYQMILRSCVRADQKSSQAPMVASLIGGGLAGAMFFVFAYPLDYLKTLAQTDDLKKPKYKNLLDCFLRNMKEGGVGTFYKGFLITLNRGFFVNAGGFFAFELSMRSLGRDENSQ